MSDWEMVERDLSREAMEEYEELRGRYEQVFLTTGSGRAVLKDILRDHYFLEVAKKPEHVVLQQQAVILLRKLGLLIPGEEGKAIDALVGERR